LGLTFGSTSPSPHVSLSREVEEDERARRFINRVFGVFAVLVILTILCG